MVKDLPVKPPKNKGSSGRTSSFAKALRMIADLMFARGTQVGLPLSIKLL
jgi:hypothetical protein